MSKHKNICKQRKARFQQSCLDAYNAGIGLGRKKRNARRMAKALKTV